MRIGELLIAENHLTQEDLQEALDWQVLYGGRLGTNLLELRLVEEKHLAGALGRQLGCETTWGEIAVAPEMIAIVPKHIADRSEIVPWKMEKRRLKLLCTEIKLEVLDQLSYKISRPCVPVVAPEFRVFNLLRAHYQALRQMRALDFGVVPDEGREERRRKKRQAEKHEVLEPAPELIDEASFNDIYNKVLAGRGVASSAAEPAPVPPAPPTAPPPQAAAPPASVTVAPAHPPGAPARAAPPALAASPPAARSPGAAPAWNPAAAARPSAPPILVPQGNAPRQAPADDALEELPAEAIVGEAGASAADDMAALPPVRWDEPAPPAAAARDESPLAFDEALRLLKGVSDRDAIAHIVLRASRSKAARALLMTVQGGVALGWDGLGEGMGGHASRNVAVPLAAQSAFQLVVKTRSHFMGPLQKTPSNIRFLAATGKQIPLSSLLFPILYRGRVSHLLYLDNGHKQQAPTDVGEMLILSQRITQSVEALVERKRKGD
jgi:Type II secretion system (T2SS), protein E, N-terminal domain